MYGVDFGRRLIRRSGLRAVLSAVLLLPVAGQVHAEANTAPQNLDFAALPPFLSDNAGSGGPGSASFLIAASRDHRLFFKAYNDFSDITGDGVADTGYMQNFEYYGYFDPDKCYRYVGSRRWFTPDSFSPQDQLGAYTRDCSGQRGRWSGNILNWATMARIDVVRKILYGGKRSTDSNSQTVLEAAHLPSDGHSFAKYVQGNALISASTPRGAGSEITFCRSTVSWDRVSHDDDSPPLLRWVRGDYRLWSSNERQQCSYNFGDNDYSSINATEGGGNRNENDRRFSGMSAAGSDPTPGQGLRGNGNPVNSDSSVNPAADLVVRVVVCVETLINGDNKENCRQYPNGSWKPAGVLQDYGDSGDVKFGLITGSYQNNQRGGVLRKSLSTISNEFDSNTGRVRPLPAGVSYPGSIVKSFDALRVFGRFIGTAPATTINFRDANEGNYIADTCGFQQTDYDNGACRSWGNPFAEILRESVNYLVGGTPTPDYQGDDTMAFVVSDGTVRRRRPYSLSWAPPLAAAQSDAGYLEDLKTLAFDDPGGLYSNDDLLPAEVDAACSPVNILAFNSGLVDYDQDQMEAFSYTGGQITRGAVRDLVNEIGDLEGISGGTWVVPYAGNSGDYLCQPRVVNRLSTVDGVCPEAPTTRGSYWSAGMAYYAHINDLRSDVSGEQTINLLAVELSPDIPRIDIPDPNDPSVLRFTILPGYSNTSGTRPGAGQVMEFIVVEPHTETSPGIYTGRYFVSYEDSISGGDFDQDLWGVLSYSFNPAADTVEVTTDLIAFSSGGDHHFFGFTILGSTQDGYHAYSGNNRTVGAGCPGDPALRDVPLYDGELYRTGANPVPACGQETGADLDANGVMDVLLCVERGHPVSNVWGVGGMHWDDCRFTDPSTGPRDPGIAQGDVRIPPVWPQPVSHTFTGGATNAADAVLNRPLWYAAKYGGFRDSNDNNEPDVQSEWDASDIFGDPTPDGIPDNYFPISNPSQLPDAMVRVFEQGGAVQRTASGTAAAVVANERQGVGAVFQALFEPTFTDTDGNIVTWVGSLHALFIDSEGLLREDGNDNRKLDGYTLDPVVQLSYDESAAETVVLRFSSSDSDVFTQSGVDTVGLSELEYLWNARDTLSDKTNFLQRAYGVMSVANRHIFTWVDKDADGITDGAEVVDFVALSFKDIDAYSSFNLDLDSLPDGLPPPQPDAKAAIQVERLVSYIRGDDTGSSRSDPLNTMSPSPASRIRQADYDGDGSAETLLLGDIVHSSPVSVGQPAENYDLLTGDTSYATFRSQYEHRRQVVYIGANDGMLHAFNAGFYDPSTREFKLSSPGGGTEQQHALGEELWAYVPNAILPYLQYLRDENYQHMYFVDGNPRIFDAKIFTPDTAHPGGWGTVLVVGLRMGAASENNDFMVDQSGDGLTNPPDNDLSDNRAFLSVYIVMDVTNPEVAPTVLAEINVDGTYATVRPGVVHVVDPAGGATNRWYLLLGSGPVDLATGETSALPPRDRAIVEVYDLRALAQRASAPSPDRTYTMSGTLSEFVGGIVVSDFDLDLKAEAIYFGTVGSSNGDEGDLYRIAVAENPIASVWGTPVKLLDADRPFVARPALAVDDEGNRWVYAGSGRLYTAVDNASTAQQTLYGFIDENALDNTTDSKSVTAASLKNVSRATSLTDGRVNDPVAADVVSFAAFRERVKEDGGWRLDYSGGGGVNPSERSTNPSSLLGEVLFNSAFTPPGESTGAQNACGSADIGTSALYGLDFLSGVPHTIGVFGQSSCTLSVCTSTVQESLGRVDLGSGLASAPSLHLGQPDQSAPGRVTVVVQQSTGEIRTIEGQGVAPVSSQELDWREYIE